jgi:hypothetical protein
MTVFRLGPRAQARRDLALVLEERAREIVACANQPAPEPAAPKPAPRRPAPRRWTLDTIVAAIHRHAEQHGRPPSWLDWRKAGPDHPSANTVSEHVGWANAIEAAGYPRPVQNGTAR